MFKAAKKWANVLVKGVVSFLAKCRNFVRGRRGVQSDKEKCEVSFFDDPEIKEIMRDATSVKANKYYYESYVNSAGKCYL